MNNSVNCSIYNSIQVGIVHCIALKILKIHYSDAGRKKAEECSKRSVLLSSLEGH